MMLVTLDDEFEDLLRQISADLNLPTPDVAKALLESSLLAALDR